MKDWDSDSFWGCTRVFTYSEIEKANEELYSKMIKEYDLVMQAMNQRVFEELLASLK